MTIGRLDFDRITDADLTSLIETGVPEGLGIEYKQGTYPPNDEGVREYLKDTSALANTAGGHIVIGMEEQEGLPTKIVPALLNTDNEILRLENLLRDGLSPRVLGVRMRAVPVQGGKVIVIRVPRSWNPPHQISAKKTRRFYIRNSNGSHEELRASFSLGATARDRAKAFRTQRLAMISGGKAAAVLSNPDGKLVLHIVPLSSFSGPLIDLQKAYGLGLQLQPMGSMGMTPHYNFDGLLNVMMGDLGQLSGYTQIFRDGSIEAVTVRAVITHPGMDGRYIPTKSVTAHVMNALPKYLEAIQKLDVPPPFAVMISLTEVQGAMIGVYDYQQKLAPIRQEVLELPEILIEDYGTSETYRRATKPAFDALWNAGGHPQSQDFSENGDWIG